MVFDLFQCDNIQKFNYSYLTKILLNKLHIKELL